MDELIDILDTQGDITGKTAMKSEAHKKGWFHATVHIWFYTSDRKILLQQRGKNKVTHPLLWDVSVAGHIGAGEEIELSAIREIQEEIGLTVLKKDLEKIGVFKSVQKHNNSLLDCEFHHTYLSELNVSLRELVKQESEVEDLKLISLVQFSKEISALDNCKIFVPHNKEYYASVIKAIRKKLK